MKVIEFQDVCRGYGSEDVLSNFSMQLNAGDVLGLLGRNGAGKTTLISMIMGMLAPRKGRVLVFGQDPRLDPVATRKRIGYVGENQDLPPFLKVREIIAMYRHLYNKWDSNFADQLIERFELPSDRKIKDLSRGQARQVALLCAVSHRPELLILDEPAGGLDPAARREFLETSIRLLNEEGTTILFSSHYMSDVERMASRLIMIHERQKWIDSDLDDIREGYCLAQISATSELNSESLLSVEGCLCTRQRDEVIHAIFEIDPDTCQQRLRSQLGLAEATCRTVNLEEMFVELAGRAS